jgi:hypothetical protein
LDGSSVHKEVRLMFEELFGKASDVVFHKIAPYVVERQRFLEHCRGQGFARTHLKRMAAHNG